MVGGQRTTHGAASDLLTPSRVCSLAAHHNHRAPSPAPPTPRHPASSNLNATRRASFQLRAMHHATLQEWPRYSCKPCTTRRHKNGLVTAAFCWLNATTSCPLKPQRANDLPPQTSTLQVWPCYSCVLLARPHNLLPSHTSTLHLGPRHAKKRGVTPTRARGG